MDPRILVQFKQCSGSARKVFVYKLDSDSARLRQSQPGLRISAFFHHGHWFWRVLRCPKSVTVSARIMMESSCLFRAGLFYICIFKYGVSLSICRTKTGVILMCARRFNADEKYFTNLRGHPQNKFAFLPIWKPHSPHVCTFLQYAYDYVRSNLDFFQTPSPSVANVFYGCPL